MIDRLFTAALTFVLLAGGTAAVGNALFTAPAAPVVAAAPVQKSLPRVVVVVARAAPRQLAQADTAIQ